MDPVSLSLLAVGTVGVVSYCRNEHKRKVKATRGPTTLSEMLANLDADGLMNWPVLAVHVRSAHIAPHLARGGLMARVKVGEEGASVSCDTEETMATLPARPAASWFVAKPPQRKTPQLAVADFGSTCLFQGQRKGESFIRIRLLQAGSMGKTVAKASLRVTCSGLRQFAQMEDSLPQYLHLLQMQKRNGAFRVMPRLFTEGHVHDTTEREACALLGQAVDPSLLEAEQSCGDLTAHEHS
mmetsp:Transcript_69621/g.203772  ORF Transcript_69621/g.203772 Transcript_69621/m.203772 type:complete len:240 (+) Transcript_69621:47-766(+)